MGKRGGQILNFVSERGRRRRAVSAGFNFSAYVFSHSSWFLRVIPGNTLNSRHFSDVEQPILAMLVLSKYVGFRRESLKYLKYREFGVFHRQCHCVFPKWVQNRPGPLLRVALRRPSSGGVDNQSELLNRLQYYF